MHNYSGAYLMVLIPKPTLLIGLLVLSGTASAVPQVIGNHIGRNGQFPLLATPPGNPFVSAPGAGNEYTPAPGSETELLAALGLALFWDEQLSSDNTVACATCHAPEFGGGDPRDRFPNPDNGFGSAGVLPMDVNRNYEPGTPTNAQRQVTPVIAPTVLNAAFSSQLLWKAGAGPAYVPTTPGLNAVDFSSNAALEAQSVGPIQNDIEMAHPGFDFGSGFETKLNVANVLALATPSTVPPPVVQFLGGTYAVAFDTVFNHPNIDPALAGQQGVTRDRYAMALATYERTLVTNQAPFDTQGFSPAGRRGFDILKNSSCFSCHSTTLNPQLEPGGGTTDARDTLFANFQRRTNLNFPQQAGALNVAVGNPPGGVRTPSLRNLPLRKTLAHNGFFDSFDALFDFYDSQGPTVPTFAFTSLQPGATSLTSGERTAVRAFFDELIDPRLTPSPSNSQLPAPFWHPDLYADRVPFGSNEPATHPGTPSAPGGVVPDLILHVPLLPNSTEFKVGVRDVPPSSIGALGLSPLALPPPMAGGIMLDLTGLTTATINSDSDGFSTSIFPNTGGLPTGLTFSFQYAIFDPSNGGIAFSNAGTVLVQ